MAPKLTFEVEVKFVPVRVSVKAAPPARAMDGLRLVIVGAGGLTVKVKAEETPPALLTVMAAVPTLAISVAGTVAVSCVEVT